MTDRPRILLAALAIGLAATATATRSHAQDDAKKPEGDMAKLQGKWEGKLHREGNELPIVLEIDGDDVFATMTGPDGDEIEFEGGLKLDESKAPKTLDFVDFTGPSGDAIPDILGIYKFEAETLTIDSGGPGGDRPSKFESDPDHQFVLKKLDTEKAEKKPKGDDPDKPAMLEGDLGKLQGGWEGEFQAGGNAIPMVMEIDGSDVVIKITSPDGDEVEFEGDLKLDESKNPKTLDFFDFVSPNGDSVGESKALYMLDGDTLTIDSGGPDGPRPSKIDAGSEHHLVLKRSKAAKPKRID